MTNIAYHRSRAADHVPLATELSTTKISVCKGYLQDLSKGNRADQKGFAVLKDRVWEDALELYGIRNLPAEYNPRDYFPSRIKLHLQQTFGKNNELKSYTVLPVVFQIAVIMWKLGFLSADDDKKLAKLLPCGEATSL